MTEFEWLYAKLKALLAKEGHIPIQDIERLCELRPK